MGTRRKLVGTCVCDKPLLVAKLNQVHEFTRFRNGDFLKVLNLDTFDRVFYYLKVDVCCRLFNVVWVECLVVSRLFGRLIITKVSLNVLF